MLHQCQSTWSTPLPRIMRSPNPNIWLPSISTMHLGVISKRNYNEKSFKTTNLLVQHGTHSFTRMEHIHSRANAKLLLEFQQYTDTSKKVGLWNNPHVIWYIGRFLRMRANLGIYNWIVPLCLKLIGCTLVVQGETIKKFWYINKGDCEYQSCDECLLLHECNI